MQNPKQMEQHITTYEESKNPTNDVVKESNNSNNVTPNTATYNGRDRLKRHRVEVAGRVWVPDMWGQENLLKEWMDCTAFDKALVESNIISARNALMQEGRRAVGSTKFRIENSC